MTRILRRTRLRIGAPWVTVGAVCIALMGASACDKLEASAATGSSMAQSHPLPAVESALTVSDADPFPGRQRVTVRELFDAMRREADRSASAPGVRESYRGLMRAHGLADDDAVFADYLRIRLAFEATRAGGLWGLKWRVTDQLPQSDRIWAQWSAFAWPAAGGAPTTTAEAECDELSALFAVVATGMGLSARSQVGLFWPTANHTVAVWSILPAARPHEKTPAPVRIVVPTSQIFLDGDQTLGTDAFDPWRQPRIFPYARRDVDGDRTLPAPLVRYFLAQLRRHGSVSPGALQTQRNRREYDQRLPP